MSTETNFDPSTIEPAKVNLIGGSINVQDEHLDESTPQKVEDTLSVDTQEPNTPKVHAEPQDSDERYKNLQAAYTKASQENSELKNRLDQMEARLAYQPTPQNSFTQQPEVSTPAEPSEVDKVAEEFEELKPIANSLKEVQAEQQRQQAAQAQYQRDLEQQAQSNAQAQHEAEIVRGHNNAFQIVRSVDYKGWLARQPSFMQQLMRTGTAPEIIDLITAYKASKVTDNNQQLQNAREAGAPSSGQAPIINNDNGPGIKQFRTSEIRDMSDAEFMKNEAAINIAQGTPGGIIVDS